MFGGICLNRHFKCDGIRSCSDGADELDCKFVQQSANETNEFPAQQQQQQQQQYQVESQLDEGLLAPSLSSTTLSTSMETEEENNSQQQQKGGNRMKVDFFVALLSLLLVSSIVLMGIWIYERRKIKWKMLLDKLDSNLDWEYQQLQDGDEQAFADEDNTKIILIADDDLNQSHHQLYLSPGKRLNSRSVTTINYEDFTISNRYSNNNK